jgi:hypothetical protein
VTADAIDHLNRKGLPLGERVTAMETWADGHETLCANRYQGLRDDLKWIKGGIGAVLVAVIGWALVQVWSTRNYVPPNQGVTVLQSNSHQGRP